MGRKKIAIKPIAHPSTRRATFEKRRIGLLKKAMELSILCKSTVSLTIYTSEGEVYVYASEPYENVVQKFQNYRGPYRLLTNDHLEFLIPGKSSSNSIGYEIIKQPNNLNSVLTSPSKANPEVMMPPIAQTTESDTTMSNSKNNTNTNTSSNASNKGDTPPTDLYPNFISTSSPRRSSILSNSSLSSTVYGMHNMNMQAPYAPSFYSSQIYRSPTNFRFVGSPNRNNLMPSANMFGTENDNAKANENEKGMKSEEKSSENGSDEGNGDANNGNSKEGSSDNKYSGRRRSFNEMMEDDLVPEFDMNGMFDDPQLSEHLSSSFL